MSSERFLPRLGHTVARPFVEGGRRVHRVGSDILGGGRRKRLDAGYGGPVKESVLRDFSRATGPMALLLGTVGFSVPLAVDIIGEFLADANMGPPPGDVNWLASIMAAAAGLAVGAIANAEHSRRVGRDGRLFAEEYRNIFELWMNRASLQNSDTCFLNEPQSEDS